MIEARGHIELTRGCAGYQAAAAQPATIRR